jgi:uncharacterized membrane protein
MKKALKFRDLSKFKIDLLTMNEEKNEKSEQNQNKGSNGLMAFLAYILFFIPLLTDSKNDPFVRYHVRQGLGFFILAVIVGVINSIIPFYFWFVRLVLSLGLLVLFIIGIKNALEGKKEPLPLIGEISDKINL